MILYNYYKEPFLQIHENNIHGIENRDGLNIILSFDIKIFPQDIIFLDKIRSLNSEYCQMPENIYKLKNIEELYLNVDQIPDSIYLLEKLRLLELNNYNGSISKKILNLKKLERIVINGFCVVSFNILFHENKDLVIDSTYSNYLLLDNGVTIPARIVTKPHRLYSYYIQDYKVFRDSFVDNLITKDSDAIINITKRLNNLEQLNTQNIEKIEKLEKINNDIFKFFDELVICLKKAQNNKKNLYIK